MLKAHQKQRGFSLIEVLVTMVILAFGLLGLAGLQSKTQLAEVEAYQREQGIVLLQDMVQRINTNPSGATSYVTGTSGLTPLGTGDTTQVSDCTTVTATTATATIVAKDKCEWGNALQGASEQVSSNNVGAMIGARGCVEQVQAPDATTCAPGVYRVSVTWQGMNSTKAPNLSCASGSYGTDNTKRRLISANVTIGATGCISTTAPST